MCVDYNVGGVLRAVRDWETLQFGMLQRPRDITMELHGLLDALLLARTGELLRNPLRLFLWQTLAAAAICLIHH